MAELPEVLGVVYPVSLEVVDNIFNKNKTIFLKFTTHEPTKRTKIRIREGIKLYLYQSGGNLSIIGEAVINNFEYLTVPEILQKYKNKIMISKGDLTEYSKGREHKKILVLKLIQIRKYKQPLKLKKPVTMAGMYITNENTKEILKR